MRRSGPLSLLAIALGLLAPLGAAAQTTEAVRPNILWLSAEDLSPRIGAYGDPLARTPNLDRLASEGMRFTNAYVTYPICAPSRSAIITGMNQGTLGTMHMRTSQAGIAGLPGPYEAVPPHFVKTFTEYLRAAGYYTTNNVKTDYQFGLPMTAWDESSRKAHWRNRPDPKQPFFAVFNFEGTHESRVWASHASNRGQALVTDPARVKVPPYYPDTPLVRADLARQYDNVAALDAWAGDLLRQLEEDGLLENTIVFFWTDHGDGLPRAKRWLYDSGMHVPLVIRWPGQLAPGSVNEELVSFIDLAPTVLAMAGATIPTHLQGRVIVGPQTGPEPKYVFAGRDRVDVSYDMVRAARDRRYKYIRNFHPELPYVLYIPYRNRGDTMQELLRLHAAGELNPTQELWMQDHRPPEELYDSWSDSAEVRNLAADPAYRTRLLEMRAAVDDWMMEIGDLGRVPEAEMVQRMWPDRIQPRTADPYILPRRSTERKESQEPIFELKGPTEIAIYVATQGASVAYSTDLGEDARWKLYSGPIRVDSTITIRAKAIRYGYLPSEEVQTTIRVTR